MPANEPARVTIPTRPPSEARRPARAAEDDPSEVGLLLAFAYPDRVAQRRAGDGARYLLRNGRGALLNDGEALAREPYLVAADLGGTGQESRIQLAAPVDLAELLTQTDFTPERVEELAWDVESGLRARIVDRLGALELGERVDPSPPQERVADALLDAIRREGLAMLPWSDDAIRLRERLAFVHAVDPATWPDVSDAALLDALDDWLRPHVLGVRRRDALARVDVAGALLDRLGWRQRAALDELAPTHVTVPSGSRIRIDYADPAAPVLAVRLQEMFGARATPAIAGGRVPLTLHLLSPAHRPVQVTRDLAGFWRSSYFDVRKDLRGRYPKHEWPDDPLVALPTARAKRRT